VFPAAKPSGFGYAYDGVKKAGRSGRARPMAREILLHTATSVSPPRRRLRMGLVNQVVPDGELETYVNIIIAT